MTDLFAGYPDAPGWKRDGTSREAAERVKPQVKNLHSKILAELARCEQTPDEVAGRLGRTILAIRPRFSELVALELIEDTGRRKCNASGLQAKIWRVRPETE